MLGIGEEPLGSRDIVFWFWLFAAIVAFRAVWSGFRINENVAAWWEKRGSPTTKLYDTRCLLFLGLDREHVFPPHTHAHTGPRRPRWVCRSACARPVTAR